MTVPMSHDLLHVEMPVVSIERCRFAYKEHAKNNSSLVFPVTPKDNICAGGIKGIRSFQI